MWGKWSDLGYLSVLDRYEQWTRGHGNAYFGHVSMVEVGRLARRMFVMGRLTHWSGWLK